MKWFGLDFNTYVVKSTLDWNVDVNCIPVSKVLPLIVQEFNLALAL